MKTVSNLNELITNIQTLDGYLNFNPAISKILGAKPSINSILNKEYARYCETLGFEPRDKGAFGSER